MKRDIELFRWVLFELERLEDEGLYVQVTRPGGRQGEINYHIQLGLDAGYIRADAIQDSLQGLRVRANALTFRGHDFLDSIRNEEVWSKVNQKVSMAGGAVAFEVIKRIAVEIALKALRS